jgi:hypothetical protein
MIRLADRVRAEDRWQIVDPISLQLPREVPTRMVADHVRVALSNGLPVIVADTIAEYYYAGTTQEHWDIIRDFPLLIPPFPEFWIEWAAPSMVRSEVYGEIDAMSSSFPFSGVYVRVHEAPYVIPGLWSGDRTNGFTAGARWAIQLQPLAYVDNWGLIRDTWLIPAGDFWIAIDEHGTATNYLTTAWDVTSTYQHVLSRHAPAMIHPALLTLTFMNIRNGALAPAQQHAPEKFARSYERKKKLPLVRYHTVVVNPNRTTKPDTASEPTGRQMPVHLVRQHLVTYADEPGKRLFGKYSGTFLRQPHVRGTTQEGVSLHDYRVRAPKNEEGTDGR